MVYAYLADGRDQAGMRELDTLLAPNEETVEAIREKENMRQMEQLQSSMAGMQVGRPRV